MFYEWKERLKNRLDNFDFDFVKHRRIWALFSGSLVLASWLVFFLGSPNWGIDFTGGTEIQVRFSEAIEIGELREALAALEIPNDAVQEVGAPSEHTFKIRIKDPEFGSAGLKTQVVSALKGAMGESWVADWDEDVRFSSEVGARFAVRYQGERTLPSQIMPALEHIEGAKVEEGKEDNELVVKLPSLASQIEAQFRTTMGAREFRVLSVDAVGPRVGESLRQQAFFSLIAALTLILVYVAFRFEISFAPGAVAALIHDVSVTLGIFVLLGKELNLQFVAALLTILGYSLNDTIVIFDRIRENRSRYSRDDLTALINGSVNETLSRTLATSGATIVAIMPFLFLGTDVIQDFTLAIVLGVLFGSYSTIFVASPMIIVTERLRPWFEKLVAFDTGGESDEEDVPEEFLSESEKRRRERSKNRGDDSLVE